MRIAQEKVSLFHEKYGYATAEKPQVISRAAARVRYDLMCEELNEYLRANMDGDLVKVADGLGDLLYTVLGSCVVHGIDIQPIFDEIHRSNMTKDLPLIGDPNKPVKGESFELPRLAELLLLQTTMMGDGYGHGV